MYDADTQRSADLDAAKQLLERCVRNDTASFARTMRGAWVESVHDVHTAMNGFGAAVDLGAAADMIRRSPQGSTTSALHLVCTGRMHEFDSSCTTDTGQESSLIARNCLLTCRGVCLNPQVTTQLLQTPVLSNERPHGYMLPNALELSFDPSIVIVNELSTPVSLRVCTVNPLDHAASSLAQQLRRRTGVDLPSIETRTMRALVGACGEYSVDAFIDHFRCLPPPQVQAC